MQRQGDDPSDAGRLTAKLPSEREAWPKFSTRALVDLAGDEDDISAEELQHYGSSWPWVWPDRPHFFITDIHADADALFNSLVATGGFVKTGPEDQDFEPNDFGREAVLVFGGDYLDKGPSNLRHLRAIRHLLDMGTEIKLLAGNHDVRALVGLTHMGRKDPCFAHLFARMGRKAVPLFKEIADTYDLAPQIEAAGQKDEASLRAELFPDESWFEEFPRAAEGKMPADAIRKDLVRIREKIGEMQADAAAAGLSLQVLYAAALKARELFLDPEGEFVWLAERMVLCHRAGSFFFVHAGIDDATALVLRKNGIEGLNERFRELLHDDLFELYYGSIGNCFRTKYRGKDRPLTEEGISDVLSAGVYAIVHGHRSGVRGQRLVMRRGILNIECDTSADRNTRTLVGLPGVGGGALILSPAGTLSGVSTDYAYIKFLDASRHFRHTVFA